MKTNSIAKAAGLLALILALGSVSTGCSWSIGGGTRGETKVHATRGQELIDLKRALDQGAISQADYDAQKQKIMER